MIVPMKKLTVLCLAHHAQASLERLRDLGVLHLELGPTAETEPVETARRDFERLQRLLEAVPVKGAGPASAKPVSQLADDLENLLRQRKTLTEQRDALQQECARIAPFGQFDPAAVAALRARGVEVRLFSASTKEPALVPAGAVRVELHRDRTTVQFAVISCGAVTVGQAQEVALPSRSLGQLRVQLAGIEQQLQALQAELAGYTGDRDRLARACDQGADQLRFAQAQAGLGQHGPVAYLHGFCPATKVERLREAARDQGWGLVITEPADDDNVPTLLEHPRWVKPIEPVLTMIGILPGYREIDISWAFLVFFALFFAILIGDAGYGALFLAASLWGRRRWPQAPRPLFTLIELMSGATILWGVLTGIYFGCAPAGLALLRWPWLTDAENVKWLAFSIGVVHLTLAHVWCILRAPRSLQSIAQFGWICTTWTMYFFALKMVLGRPLPGFVGPMFVLGVVCIVLFMTPRRQLKAEWFNHAMLPLNLVSNFVDVVSYIRLFAVGTAGLAVAESFNGMLAPLFAQWWTAVFGVALLLLAHSLNIALCLMGVMVHGIRLNTLEFSGHVGLQWTGTAFTPFRRHAQPQSP